MKERILNHCDLSDPHDEDPFFIIGDKVELLPSWMPDNGVEKSTNHLSEPTGDPQRWARYPPAYFNDTFPVYTPSFKHIED